MDGNGRWAKARGLPRALGHRQGAEAVREVVKGARELGIEYLTLYAFSSENWKRPASEVTDLMDLLRLFIRREVKDLDRNGVRLRVIGDRAGLAKDLQELILEAERITASNTRLTLILALNYGAQSEILNACRRLAEQARAGVQPHETCDFVRSTAQLGNAQAAILVSGLPYKIFVETVSGNVPSARCNWPRAWSSTP